MNKTTKKIGIVRKLYDWVLHWAETPYGLPALFILAFAESSFFPVPPDILLIPLAISKPKKAFKFALVCSIASILGGMLGYYIGWGLWSVVQNWFFAYVPGFTHHNFELVQAKYNAWNFWVVFTAGFTPIPYKLITISAGVFKINFLIFILASAVSRSARFFLVSGLIFIFGEKIKKFIDKYFNLLAMLFVILLFLGSAVVKLVK